MKPQIIYITGCDGTGKSTHANLLQHYLEQSGVSVSHVWLRFPFLLSLPLLAYARLCGLSWYEEDDTIRHGYWNFQNSLILRALLPWTYLLDAALFSVWLIYLPLLLGKVIICERFVLDMLVDLAVALNDNYLHKRLPGRLYLFLLPTHSRIVLLDLDIKTIRSRRPDLGNDLQLERRLAMFRRVARDIGIPVCTTQAEVPIVNTLLRQMFQFREQY